MRFRENHAFRHLTFENITRHSDFDPARPRSAKCNPCGEGSVPELGKSSCKMCTGQMYAQPGDEVCRKCTFPSMILGEDNRCTPLYTALFLLAFFLLLFFVLAVFGRLRLHCLKRHLNKLVAGKDWEELHSTQATLFEFGLWKHQACKEVTACKQKVKSQSFQLGISLQYVFERLEDVYKDIAQKAEWRLDEWGPVTNSGYLVKARNCGLQLLDAVAAWDALPTCEYPKNPNFHQVAGLLAYGPLALGKHLCCPRDGQPDCSIVDALQAESSSAKATWFLSWVWGYSFSTVYKARLWGFRCPKQCLPYCFESSGLGSLVSVLHPTRCFSSEIYHANYKVFDFESWAN